MLGAAAPENPPPKEVEAAPNKKAAGAAEEEDSRGSSSSCSSCAARPRFEREAMKTKESVVAEAKWLVVTVNARWEVKLVRRQEALPPGAAAV